jgi:hypothetical protein
LGTGKEEYVRLPSKTEINERICSVRVLGLPSIHLNIIGKTLKRIGGGVYERERKSIQTATKAGRAR